MYCNSATKTEKTGISDRLQLNYGFETFKLFNSFGMKHLLMWKN